MDGTGGAVMEGGWSEGREAGRWRGGGGVEGMGGGGEGGWRGGGGVDGVEGWSLGGE